MTTLPPEPPGPRDPVDGFIEALRADLPSPEVDAAMRQRLRAAGLAIPAVPGAVAPVPVLATATKVWAPSMAAKLGLASVLVVGTPAAVILGTRPHADTQAAIAEAPSLRQTDFDERPGSSPATPESTTPPPPEASTGPAIPPASSASAPQHRADGRKTSRDPKPLADPSSLRAETELIERSLAALEAGEFEAARTALAAHAERFPHGLLKRERERTQRRLERSLNREPME